MSDYIVIETVEDCTEAFMEVCSDVHDGWFENEPRIDWDDFWNRLEKYGYDMGSTTDSPAMKHIKKFVKTLR